MKMLQLLTSRFKTRKLLSENDGTIDGVSRTGSIGEFVGLTEIQMAQARTLHVRCSCVNIK